MNAPFYAPVEGGGGHGGHGGHGQLATLDERQQAEDESKLRTRNGGGI